MEGNTWVLQRVKGGKKVGTQSQNQVYRVACAQQSRDGYSTGKGGMAHDCSQMGVVVSYVMIDGR